MPAACFLGRGHQMAKQRAPRPRPSHGVLMLGPVPHSAWPPLRACVPVAALIAGLPPPFSRYYDATMSKVESLLSEAKSPTNAERRRLAELLLEEAALEAGADDAAAGLRGLRAWTEATAGEDW